jgi:hypothetical protein
MTAPVHTPAHTPAPHEPLLALERPATVRDRFTARVTDPRVDHRVVSALVVGTDAVLRWR